MSNDVLFAEYLRVPAVRSRNTTALLRWSAYVSAETIPATKPDATWTRNRIVADRMPENIDGYVQRTIAFFLQDPAVLQNIYPWLTQYNPPDVEDQLTNQNSAIIGGFMPRFALTDVTDQAVSDWWTQHGFV